MLRGSGRHGSAGVISIGKFATTISSFRAIRDEIWRNSASNMLSFDSFFDWKLKRHVG
jgi:hypothetical protein